MSTELNADPQTAGVAEWQPPTPPTDLVFDDGEPMESNRHRIAMNTLIRSLNQAWDARRNFFAGGNMFIYFSSTQARNRDFRGPDFFVVLDVDGERPRQGWVVWEEEGRYPDVIVELLSASTAGDDRGIKKSLYERTFKTPEYFLFDPFEPAVLEGWRLGADLRYQPLTPNERGWLWCEALSLWLGTWQGTLDRESAVWLRFYDETGRLVLLPEEVARQQAEQAEQQAQQAQQQAQQRAEQAEQQAERERRHREVLARRLRALGFNPDDLME
ncbi:Uma2 family endonuclease [Gloeobacter morelensis]|uniref:Uma2 family endonuclease n=1 Tax=Gloeobacter morelensis MG652769 TaxID=2781736 RepID=A0ABY3PJM3_9CYAN|nr:Uma2 family endonuclease [Gloeobacter morelensis]UFP93838.1 Uma2 family endonuclease [Gloeobacter morelensis MG652769]